MSPQDIQYWADVASIATFLVACSGVFTYFWQLRSRRRKRKALERYLRVERQKSGDKGQRSILRIMRDIGLTQDEIIQASFQSKRIRRLVVGDKETGLASELLLQYSDRASGAGA